MRENANNYRYKTLDHAKTSFRLLRLHQGRRGMLVCSLFEALLHDPIQYEALSYTWGAPTLSKSIDVDGKILGVTENLYQALVSLRNPHSDRILWVDAVCINQDDTKERSHQVGQMTDIYKQAESVIFFLGHATYGTDAFMEYMGHVQEERNEYAYRSWTRDDGRWKMIKGKVDEKMDKPDDLPIQGLRSLLGRPWFHRVWILQEVANAKAAIVCCGRRQISASIFSIAPAIFDVNPKGHCQSVIDIMPGPWRKTSWWSKSPSLYTLLVKFGGAQATESRDLIYALRGIATDQNSSILKPDYDKPEECVVRDAVHFLFDFEYDAKKFGNIGTTIRDVVKNLERVKDVVLLERIKAGEMNCLENLLQAPGIIASQIAIQAAIEFDKTGDLTSMLLKYISKECEMNKAIFLLAVEKGTVSVVEVLVNTLKDKAIIGVTKETLVAAASNQSQGALMMKYLLPKSQSLNDYTEIAEVAASNRSQAVKIIEQLLDCPITMTPQLHNNALMGGCYKEIFQLFIDHSVEIRGNAQETDMDGNKEKNDADTARAFFECLANFLIGHGAYNEDIFHIFKQSCRWLEHHGYFFLEELASCAAQYFKDSSSPQHDQFNRRLGTLDWIGEESGLEVWVTSNAVQASLDGNFKSGMWRLLTTLQDSANIHALAAARIVGSYELAATEHILLHRGGSFRHHELVLNAFRTRYCYPEDQPAGGWLNKAISGYHRESAQLMISYGANPNESDTHGDTPLIKACEGGDCRIPAMLISRNADINAQREDATRNTVRSPLLCAVKRGYLDLLELLLVCGAHVNAAGYSDKTPLMEAVIARSSSAVVRLLLQYGADTTPWNSSSYGVDHSLRNSSGAINALLRKPPQPSPITIRPSVQKMMTEFGLVPKPNGWSLKKDPQISGNLWSRVRELWRRKNGNSMKRESSDN